MLIARLLQIKEFREDRAQQEVRRATRVLEDADRGVADAGRRLHEHQADCHRREREIYAELCTRMVLLKDLDDAQLQVDQFKQSIKDHKAAVEEAREHRSAMADCLEEARKLLAIAISAREKFTQLRELGDAELQLELARAEEAELEEVPTRKSPVAEEQAA